MNIFLKKTGPPAALPSGTALTNDSGGLADMRVWLDEERNRGPVWSERPRPAGSHHRIGEQFAEACMASAYLAGQDGRAAAVAFFEDLVEITASTAVERVETPIV